MQRTRRVTLTLLTALIGVVLWASPAVAHKSTVSTETACTDGHTVVAATWDNDHHLSATVSESGNQRPLPGFGTVTVNYTVDQPKSVPWTVVWSDGFQQSGTLTMEPIDDCEPLPPCPERVNGPTCPDTTTTTTSTTSSTTTTVPAPTTTTTVASLPPVTTTAPPTGVLASSPSPGDGASSESLAFTGARTRLLVGFALLLISGGTALAAGANLKRRSRDL